jgi:hypothetical protein
MILFSALEIIFVFFYKKIISKALIPFIGVSFLYYSRPGAKRTWHFLFGRGLPGKIMLGMRPELFMSIDSNGDDSCSTNKVREG